MSDRICSIEGCENISLAKNLCSKHYSRFKVHGNVNANFSKKKQKCSISGCDDWSVAHKMCSKHYQRFQKHGSADIVLVEKNGEKDHPEYSMWSNMKYRCSNKNSKDFHRYGGRGITVCDRWKNSFLIFISDMGNRPTSRHQIDRIDNNGNYEPKNCRWVTPAENMRNQSSTKLSMKEARELRKLYPEISIKDLAK